MKLTAIVSMLCITACYCAYLIHQGTDGVVLSTIVAVLAGLGGYVWGRLGTSKKQ